jgi:hypothetical protein
LKLLAETRLCIAALFVGASSDLQDYFWDYDNKGLKVAQLRFYEHATDVN